MTINASRINITTTHADSMPIARRILDAQQRADDAGARAIENNITASQEITEAVTLNANGSDGGLDHVHRAADIVGVSRSAGITAYHRALAAEHVARTFDVAAFIAAGDAAAAAAADATADIAAE